MKLPYLCLSAALALSSLAHAQITIPKLFSSHMVLQRDMPIHLWGDAAPGEQVAATLPNATAAATTDRTGRWSIYLPPQPAGGPFTLTLHASNTIQLDDILIGDLWLASGQSNMEMPLAGFNPETPIQDSAKEIAAANYPQIRLLHVHQDTADNPLDDLKNVTGWTACTPTSAASFSAVAYFFARDLQQKQHVPIGLIDSTWGGTPAEAWASLRALSADAAFMPIFAERAARMEREATAQRLAKIDAQLKAQGKPPVPGRDWRPYPASWRPAALFNAMIAPLAPLPIRGVIWYQGESNSGYPDTYARLFSALIEDWRAQWHQPGLPFLYVQISAYTSTPGELWGNLRDAQRRALHLANTGMAVSLDIGDEHNVHPANKQAVGERLSLLARNLVFGEDIVASGPLFRFAYPDRSAMHVWFTHAAGLTSRNGPPQSFEVAGPDGVFAPATAKIEADTIIVSSPAVPDPRYVRYAWPNYPAANLFNAAGLPASTFTSYPIP